MFIIENSSYFLKHFFLDKYKGARVRKFFIKIKSLYYTHGKKYTRFFLSGLERNKILVKRKKDRN